MQIITYSREHMHKLYNGSEEDIHFVITEFVKELKSVKQALANSYIQSDPRLFSAALHKNYAGFAYAGFPQVSDQIKTLVENCQKIKNTSEVDNDFNKLLIAIDECNEICMKQISLYKSRQSYAC